MNINNIIKSYNSLIIKAAIEAGKKILEIYNQHDDFEIEYKSDNSPLTIADKSAHLIIKKHLDTTGIPILSEEGRDIPYSERKHWDTFWIVDPLDGTKEFINRNGEFTVNIALIHNQKPVMGVIYAPVLDILYVTGIDNQSYKLTNCLERSDIDFENIVDSAIKLPVKTDRENYIVVGSRSHRTKETEDFINILKKDHTNIDIMSVGSSLKLCMIAEGKADIYPRFGPTMEWDIAAGHAIINCAGFSIKNTSSNKEPVYNKEHLLNEYFIVC